MRLSHDIPSRMARFCFAVLMALAWAGYGDLAQASPQRTDNSAADLSPQQVQAAAEPVSKAFQGIEALDRQVSRETFDVHVIVDKVGREPAKLRDWVAKETELLPYRGVLRGPVGVLMDRLGNSLDRSLLLARLLQTAGVTVRLAHAQLSAAQAQQLLSEKSARRESPQTAPRPDLQAAAEQYAKEQGQDPLKARAEIGKFLMHIDRMAEDVAQGAAAQLPVVSNAVGKPTAQKARDNAAEIEATRDHWWVQQRDGEKWVDLDPSLTAGKSPQPQQTLDSDVNMGKFPIEATLYHQVRVRVMVEQWKDGKLQETPVLEHALRPSELIGQRIVLSQLPVEWPSDLNLLAESDPAGKLRTTVLAQHEWVPVLSVGSQGIIQNSFRDSGDVIAKPKLDEAGKLVSSLTKPLNEQLGALEALANDSAVPAKSAGVLTAEWIEFQTMTPGRGPRTVRREIFDLLSPAARSSGVATVPTLTDRQRLDRGLAVLGTNDILPLGCQLSSEFVEHVAITSLLENRTAMLNLLRSGGTDAKQTMDEIAKLSPLPAPLYNWALARAAWSGHRSEICLDQTNLVCLRRQLRANQQEQPFVRVVIDIVANPVALRPGVNARPFQVRLEQGVVDTDVEWVVLGQHEGALSMPDLFNRVTAQGINWVVLRPGDQGAAGRIDAPPDDRVRIEHDLAAGYAVVAPQNSVEIAGRRAMGWWRVDPESGESLGMNQFGGSVALENALLLLTFGTATGLLAYIGCGGLTGSGPKKVGCMICAIAAEVMAILALAAVLEIGGATLIAGGKALGSAGGVIGSGFTGMGCNALSGFTN